MSTSKLKPNVDLDKRKLVYIGVITVLIITLIYIFTVGGYTITNRGYLDSLRDESIKNYERAVISYNVGLLEGYSEALYLAVISSYNTWTMTNDSDVALNIIETGDLNSLVKSIRAIVNSLSSYAAAGEHYRELANILSERGSAVLDAYERYLEYLNKGDIDGAKEAIKDMRYNIDMLRIAGGNIVVRT